MTPPGHGVERAALIEIFVTVFMYIDIFDYSMFDWRERLAFHPLTFSSIRFASRLLLGCHDGHDTTEFFVLPTLLTNPATILQSLRSLFADHRYSSESRSA